jgi:signal transduction histidine kinase
LLKVGSSCQHRVVTIAARLGLYRRRQRRIIAGVAGGLADRLGIGDLYVRAALVTLTAVWGLGLVLYAMIWWATLELEDERAATAVSPRQKAGLAMAFTGGVWLLHLIGLAPDGMTLLVTAAVSFGLAALWDRSESGSFARIILPGRSGGLSVFRLLGGLVLLVGGLATLARSVQAFSRFGVTLLAVVITVGGGLLAFGPWIVRMGEDLTRERRERIRQEERAEMAAHLHDSVLQTLALMQRTTDPRRMATLARAQERELRTWLYGGKGDRAERELAGTLEAAAARVEDDHQVAVDVVHVGDAAIDAKTRALVAAATEAMVNAAKHSGAGLVSVFLEVGGQVAEVWVTDQGKGFDPMAVPADRRGIADSVVGRMQRHGGKAEIISSAGEGTEVHLVLPGIVGVGT